MRVILTAVLLVGCGLSEQAGAPDEDGEPLGAVKSALGGDTATLRVALNRTPPMHWVKKAKIATTDELFFVAAMSVPSGAHSAAFEIHDAFDNLYQRDDVAFEGGHGETRVLDSMPVLGTWISQYDMRGRWTCQLFLDGSTDAAALTAFDLH